MQGVPEQFSDERDRARIRHLAQIPGVELYHAHISRYAFEPHTHEAFGIGAIEAGGRTLSLRHHSGTRSKAGCPALMRNLIQYSARADAYTRRLSGKGEEND